MSNQLQLDRLLDAYRESPASSLKVNTYFPIYTQLFAHLVGTDCTFVETGVFNGGSLFMWRSWLGPDANIVGLDLNPEAKKWEEHGFDIYICDQGNPEELGQVLSQIGPFDALLDDGGHQSFQQITTLRTAMQYAKETSIIAIEDTHTSFMKEFARHGQHSFCEYAKDSTDLLTAKAHNLFPGHMPPIDNPSVLNEFQRIHSVEFFSNLIAFKLSPLARQNHEHTMNKPPENCAQDFRYHGRNSSEVNWPNPFLETKITLYGGGA